tara:strand:- start:39 stop:200 length:162 start_codon:yes stop_codon:yes gene_type:complete
MTENTQKITGEALEALKREQEDKAIFAEENMNGKYKSPSRAMRRKLERLRKTR